MSNDPFFYALNGLILGKSCKNSFKVKKGQKLKRLTCKQCSKQTMKSQTGLERLREFGFNLCEFQFVYIQKSKLSLYFTILNWSNLCSPIYYIIYVLSAPFKRGKVDRTLWVVTANTYWSRRFCTWYRALLLQMHSYSSVQRNVQPFQCTVAVRMLLVPK